MGDAARKPRMKTMLWILAILGTASLMLASPWTAEAATMSGHYLRVEDDRIVHYDETTRIVTELGPAHTQSWPPCQDHAISRCGGCALYIPNFEDTSWQSESTTHTYGHSMNLDVRDWNGFNRMCIPYAG